MSKKKARSLIKNQEDMEAVMAQELGMYYLSFLGDAVIVKKEIVFEKHVAEKYYENLVEQVLKMYAAAKNQRQQVEASSAYMSLSMVPLRIH
jgi:type II secretory pathway component GspD/PulD (secretin)